MPSIFPRLVLRFLPALICLFPVPRISAATTALIMPGASAWLISPDRTDGYHFSIDRYITVTALGFYDFEGNGLASPHQIGLWDANGVLLGTVEVPAGTSAYLEHDFRWVDLPTPIVISSGTYTVAGTDGDDAVATDYTRVMAAEITYIEGAWVDSGTLSYPTGSQPVAGMGGNFQYDNVPEPSVSTLIVLGTFSAWAARRRRQKEPAGLRATVEQRFATRRQSPPDRF
jgi:hypothetical protein